MGSQGQSQSTTKRVYTRLDFTLDQEERVIDFVKLNPPLYDPKDAMYKNKMYRDRLWADLGSSLNKTGI